MKNALLSLAVLSLTSSVSASEATKNLIIDVGFHDQSYTTVDSHLTYARHYRVTIPVITTSYSEMAGDSRFTSNEKQCLEHLIEAFAESKEIRNILPLVEKATFRIGKGQHDLSVFDPIGWAPGNVKVSFPREDKGRHIIIELPVNNYCGKVTPRKVDKAITKALLKSRDEDVGKASAERGVVKAHKNVLDALRRIGIVLPDGKASTAPRKLLPASTEPESSRKENKVNAAIDIG